MNYVKCLVGLIVFLGMVSGAEPAAGKKPKKDLWGRVTRDESGVLFNYLPADGGIIKLRLDKDRKVISSELLAGENAVDLEEEPDQNSLSKLNVGFSSSTNVRLEWRKGIFGSNIGGSNICIADIDQDSNLEIVLAGSTTTFGADNFWHVIRYDPSTSSYQDVWVSDYYATTISRIVIADLDKNGTLEIVLGLGNGSIQIFDGSSLQLENSLATPAGDINELAVGDVDLDGANELIFCDNSSIYVYDAPTLTLEWNSGSYGGYGLAIGNVDGDAAIEIVTTKSGDKGYVVDGSSHILEWEYTGGFGSIVRLEDIDGDGMKEIVGADAWYYLTAFDADIKSPKWQITADLNINSLRVMDIDNDSVMEVLYGDGQWGKVYCINSQTQNLEWSINNPEHGTTDIGAADVDGDGTTELLWGAGASSTGEDHLYVADFAVQTIEWWNEHLDGPFQAFDVGDVDGDGENEIVMGSYESDSGYDSGVVLIYDASTHDFEWSSGPLPDARTWTGLQSIKVADVDQDGDNEYLVGTANLYDGLILCYNGDTHLLEWSTPKYSGVTFRPIDVCDVDNDGQMEVIGGVDKEHTGADGVYVYVFNGSDGTEEWHSINLGTGWPTVYGLRVTDVDNDGKNEIIAGIRNGTIWIFDGVTKALEGQIDRGDTLGLAVFDIDSDGVQEILVGTSGGKVVVYNGVTHAQEAEWQLTGSPIDAIEVLTSPLFTPNPALLLGSGGTLRIVRYPELTLFWQSPILGSQAGHLNNIVAGDIDSDFRNEIIISGSHALNVYELSEVPTSTPTPPLTVTPTPEGYKTATPTPSPPPSPTPSPTPDYCVEPLMISDVESAQLAKVRANNPSGFVWRFLHAEYPSDRSRDFGVIFDCENDYIDYYVNDNSPVILYIYQNSRPVDVRAGDHVTVEYDGGQTLKIYPPALSGENGIFYVGIDGSTYTDKELCILAKAATTPTPSDSQHLVIDSGDYNGDGTSDIAIFRPSSGLWSVRGVTRAYFGSASDIPVPGDYNGDGTTDIGVFRGSSGLWGVRGVTRVYYGSSTDIPVPGDYNGNGRCDIGIFRASSGLWGITGVTRAYFGNSGDIPVPGDYNGDGNKEIALFRPGSGMWAIQGLPRVYYGSSSDSIVPGDYNGDGTWEAGIFRPSTGMWGVAGVTRAYFGSSSDQPVPADYNGDNSDDIAVFRGSSGLWGVRGVTRAYYGSSDDLPVTR